jgi:hypothetical protein
MYSVFWVHNVSSLVMVRTKSFGQFCGLHIHCIMYLPSGYSRRRFIASKERSLCYPALRANPKLLASRSNSTLPSVLSRLRLCRTSVSQALHHLNITLAESDNVEMPPLTSMPKNLHGKTILITGASSGIGRSTAFEFARTSPSDLKLILAARRIDRLHVISREILAEVGEGVKVCVQQLNVSKPEEVRELVAGLPEEFRDVDVLVNNAYVNVKFT